MMAWFKVAILSITLLLGIGSGWYTSERIRVIPLKAEVKIANSQIVELIRINDVNTQAYTETIEKSNKLIKTLEKRLKAKDNTCNEAIRILTLTGGHNEQVSEVGSDPILDMLNSLYPWVQSNETSDPTPTN